MVKIFGIYSLLALFTFLFFVPFAAAQMATSNCVITKVGNPVGDPKDLPPACTGDSPGDIGPKPPNYPSDLKKAIKDKFNITMNGFTNDELKWAWERFWAASNTKFNSLVKGAVVTKVSTRYSRQVGCPPGATIQLHGGYPEVYFKFIITHELGHAIRNCSSRKTAHYNEHINAYAKEGSVSYYGGHASACTGSDNHSEDYADTIAYYMNPKAGESSGPGSCDSNRHPKNPYFELKPNKALHLNNVAIPVLKK